MELDQVREQASSLRAEIWRILNRFEKDTRTKVNSIELIRDPQVKNGRGKHKILIDVNLEVIL